MLLPPVDTLDWCSSWFKREFSLIFIPTLKRLVHQRVFSDSHQSENKEICQILILNIGDINRLTAGLAIVSTLH